MPEKLAIVTIDAGSNMTGNNPLFPERVGTSSGKGTLASAIRINGGLAYDSGRAYRTITAAAVAENLDANSPAFLRALSSWVRAERFGHCATGLSLDEVEIPEQVLHAVDISRRVASFGEVPEVRRLTKDMKIAWLRDYATESGAGIIGFDGRAMKEFVEGEVLDKLPQSELVSPLSMVVEVTEAARRRMAQRKELVYNDPHWTINPKLGQTVTELTERAKQDEKRLTDPVIIPNPHYTYAVRGGELRVSPLDKSNLEDYIKSRVTALIDTTGAGVEEVQRVGMGHILLSMDVLGGFDRQVEDLKARLARI
jgi:cytidylate kinase